LHFNTDGKALLQAETGLESKFDLNAYSSSADLQTILDAMNSTKNNKSQDYLIKGLFIQAMEATQSFFSNR
jgi:hypothetical protein